MINEALADLEAERLVRENVASLSADTTRPRAARSVLRAAVLQFMEEAGALKASELLDSYSEELFGRHLTETSVDLPPRRR